MPRIPASPDQDDDSRPIRTVRTRRRSRWGDDDDGPRRRPAPSLVVPDDVKPGDVGSHGPPAGSRWSTWGEAVHGPKPRPSWVVTELAAFDRELGVLKTGKEADVHLVERAVPGTDRSVVLAAKRYRGSEHRMFHRDAGYVEGRRVRRSRETRAMDNRTGFGRELLAGQWAAAEFSVLSMLWGQGAAVPYPVQLDGTELLMEFIGDDGGGAPRLAQLRGGEADLADLADLWRQCLEVLGVLARNGYAHGDLSAYNLLVHRGRLVVIDLPQAVDIVANPQGAGFLRRDAENVCRWFAAHGIRADPAEVTERLLGEAGMGGSG